MKNEEADNEERVHVLEEFERLPIREQNAINYESIQCVVIPLLEMILRILNGGDDFADE